MPLERIAPDALLLQTNLTGVVADIQDDPDASTGVWLTAPALSSAATRRLYFTDTASGAGYAFSESVPTVNYFHNAGNLSGWRAGTGGTIPRYNYLVYNTEVAPTSFVTTEPTGAIVVSVGQGNFFRSPTTYKGSFAAGNWTFALALRSSTRANTADYIVKYRVWRTTDSTGASGATQITTGAIASATMTATDSTTVDTNTSATWAAPAFSLNDEYLFVTCYLHVVAAAGNTNDDLNLRKGSTTSSILTTAFTPAEPNTSLRVSFPNPENNLSFGAGLQEIRALVRKKGAGTNPNGTLSLYEGGSLVSVLSGPTAVSSTAGVVVSGTFDATGRDSTSIEAQVDGAGQIGGSLEVGAIEWNATTQVAVITAGYFASDEIGAPLGSALDQPIYNTELRVSFPTPTDQLSGSDYGQEFRVSVRKKGLGSDPSVTVQLMESGVLRSTLVGPVPISSTTEFVLSLPWRSNLVTNLLGSEVEMRVVGTGVAGGTLEIGAIEWNTTGYPPQIINPYFESKWVSYPTAVHGEDSTVNHTFAENSGFGVYAMEVKGPLLGASFIGALTAGPYVPGQYVLPTDVSQMYAPTLTALDPSNVIRVAPDAIVGMSGLFGAVTDVDDDPDNPDVAFLTLSP